MNDEEKKSYPPSGRFIVADILPPKHQVGLAAARAASPTAPRPRKTSAATPVTHKIPKRPSILLPSEEMTEEDLTKTSSAVDAWFQKGKDHLPKASPVETFSNKRGEESSIPPIKKPRKHRVLPVVVGLLIVVLGGGYGALAMLSKLYVTIEPRTERVVLDREMIVSTGAGEYDMLGELVSISVSDAVSIPVTGQQQVQKKASGTLIIYNTYSTKPQTLIANTRFQAPDGKIYRISKAVTVPGGVMENGKLTAGSVEAVVTADVAGPSYNKELTDFTIPGFKGTDKFEKFYGRSKTPISGGFVGESKVVTQDDMDMAFNTLESSLKTRVTEDLNAAVPEGFMLREGTFEITTDVKEFSHQVGDPTDTLQASFTVGARGIAIKKEDLAVAIAKLQNLPAEDVEITNLDTLPIAVTRRNIEAGNMALRLNGEVSLTWNIPEEALKQELVGVSEAGQFNEIFQRYSSISRAEESGAYYYRVFGAVDYPLDLATKTGYHEPTQHIWRYRGKIR